MTEPPAPPRRGFARARRLALWGLIVVSIASLLLSPLDATIEQVAEVAPWVGLGLALSEALFIGGLAMMAWTVGVRLGWNPLGWRQRLTPVMAAVDRTPAFWLGLAVNTIGAVGTAVVLVAGIVSGLPISTWGLLALPAADLSLTAAIRVAVVSGVRRHRPERNV